MTVASKNLITVPEGLAREPARTRKAQRQATRDAVIDAGIELFSERGFDGTALPAITALCGVPVPLIIYHFKDKDRLWRACVDEVYHRLEEQFEKHSGKVTVATGYPFFRAHIRAHIRALAACPAYMRILFQEGTRRTTRLEWLVQTHQRSFTQRIVALIERAQAEGYLPEMNVIHAKFVLSGALSFPIVLAPEYRLIDDVDPQSDGFIERHVDLCMQLLMPQPDQRAPVAGHDGARSSD
jgi:TetR/AcrR family transcriptional regulator